MGAASGTGTGDNVIMDADGRGVSIGRTVVACRHIAGPSARSRAGRGVLGSPVKVGRPSLGDFNLWPDAVGGDGDGRRRRRSLAKRHAGRIFGGILTKGTAAIAIVCNAAGIIIVAIIGAITNPVRARRPYRVGIFVNIAAAAAG